MTESGSALAEEDNADLLAAVFKPVSESYYTERVKSGGSARLRAQAAQSTVSLFVGGVIAAFSVTALRDGPPVSRWAAAVAVCCWLLSSALYMRAVAAPVKDPIYEQRAKDRNDLVDKVLEHTLGEVRQIDLRQKQANFVAMMAIVATCVAFVTAVTVVGGPLMKPGEAVVAPAYLASLRAACPGSSGVLIGSIESDTIDQAFVMIEVSAAQCGGRSAQIYVPQADVASLVTFGG